MHMIGFGLEAGARGIQNAKVWHQIHGSQKCDRPALPCVVVLRSWLASDMNIAAPVAKHQTYVKLSTDAPAAWPLPDSSCININQCSLLYIQKFLY